MARIASKQIQTADLFISVKLQKGPRVVRTREIHQNGDEILKVF